MKFQFTHPGGVRLAFSHLRSPRLSFNSRTREGCDVSECRAPRIRHRVSIHAPGRGATSSSVLPLRSTTSFQFTHPGGVRQACAISDSEILSFNSRTREGCDRWYVYAFRPHRCFNSRTREGCDPASCPQWCAGRVSIHAPGRGATQQACKLVSVHREFQFTHPGGVRLHRLQTSVHQCKFQFTHPGGVRQLLR